MVLGGRTRERRRRRKGPGEVELGKIVKRVVKKGASREKK